VPPGAEAPDFFERHPALVADVMKSRTKLTTECVDVRHYIEGRFLSDPDAAIIVAGDLNDGPGKERVERRFLYHDLVSNLQGDIFFARRFLNHALFDFDEGARWSYDLGRDRLDPGRSPRILDGTGAARGLALAGAVGGREGRARHPPPRRLGPAPLRRAERPPTGVDGLRPASRRGGLSASFQRCNSS
jgi:hypothetical protein